MKLLTKERQLIQKVEQLEDSRQETVETLFIEKKVKPKEKTLTELLTILDNEKERQSLEQAMTTLVDIIISLKDSEQLNNSLLQQSMQFVQLTLDMIQPESKNINYSNQSRQKQPSQGRSVFDSKV